MGLSKVRGVLHQATLRAFGLSSTCARLNFKLKKKQTGIVLVCFFNAPGSLLVTKGLGLVLERDFAEEIRVVENAA